mgnify:CR=1 FL=1
MSIPTQTEMSLIVLNIMADGKERSRAQTKANVRQHLNLSEDECNLKTSSGVCVYESRVGWSMSYLARANMLRNVKRGVYVITDFGSIPFAPARYRLPKITPEAPPIDISIACPAVSKSW